MAEVLERTLTQLAAVWPLAIAVQMLACAVPLLVGVAGPRARAAPCVVSLDQVTAAIPCILSVAIASTLRLGASRGWRAYRRNRIVMPCVAAIAAVLVPLLSAVAHLPADPRTLPVSSRWQAVRRTAATAVQPLRAATFGFGVGAVAMVAIRRVSACRSA